MKKGLLKVKFLFLICQIWGCNPPSPCTPIPTALLRACKVEARFKGTMEKPRHHLNSKSVRTLRINGLENTYDAIRNGFQASLGDSALQIFTMGTRVLLQMVYWAAAMQSQPVSGTYSFFLIVKSFIIIIQ